MKIGILTFHKPINYGAFLQAFSLSNKLNEYFESVEIVDYISPKERRNIFYNFLRDIKNWGFIGGYKSIKKIEAFKRSQKRLLLSDNSFCTNNLNKLYDYIETNYDCLIIGSDAIFNWNQTGFPTPFIPNRKLSIPVYIYAASVHGMHFYNVDNNMIEQCKQSFENTVFIGTRDSCTERFVKYCCPSSMPIHCCDPTLFLNLESLKAEAGDYKSRIKKKYGISLSEKYIVIMSPDSALVNEVSKRYCNDYRIIHVFEGLKNNKNYLYDLSPFEWSQVLANASAVVTRFFHGTLLSLLNETPAIVIDYSNYNNEYESKLKDLMITRLNLPEFYYDMSYAINYSSDKRPEFFYIFDCMLKGDYEIRIKNALMNESKTSLLFFETLLGSYENKG